MANNIITAVYSSSNITYTKSAYQYDYGMILKFSGIELPQAYEVHFSNTEFCGESISQIGNSDGVTIPDEMFLSGNPIYAWTFLHTGEDDGETVYKAVIGVNKRAQPSNLEPTPVQQDAITQAIAALNVAVEQTAQDVIDAGAAATAAETAQGLAESARDAAVVAQGKAEDAQTAAETAQGKAEDAQQAAETAAGSILNLTADATVDSNVGTPSVEVEVTTESDHKNMSFAFHNLKGVQGDTGVGISSVVLNPDYTLTITLTNGVSYTTSSIRGEVGATPNLTIGTVSTLPEGEQATATITGTDEDPVLNLGIPVGDTGDPGVSPTITVTEITGGHNIEITDAQGTTDFDVMDGEVSEEQLETALIDKADVITSSASGEIVTIQDGGDDLPVVDLSVSLLPVQDLNGQDAPYPPGGGKNKLDPSTRTAYSSNRGYRWYEADGFTLKANTAYTFSVTFGNPIALYIIDKATTTVLANGNNSATYTPTADTIVYFQAYRAEDISGVDTFQLEIGSSATAYVPYSNVCPISGWTGVEVEQHGANLWDEQWVAGTINANTGANYDASPSTIRSSTYCRCVPNKTYYSSYREGNKYVRIFWYDSNKTYIGYDGMTSGGLYKTTSPSNAYYFRITIINYEKTTYDNTVCISFDNRSYVPYKGKPTIPISWQSSAGTVYGCNLSLTTGVLTVDTAKIVLDGTQSGILTNWQAKTNSVGWLYPYSITPNIKQPYYNTDPVDIISDRLKTITYQHMYNGTDNVGISAVVNTGGTPIWGLCCRMNDPTMTTASAVNAWLAQNPVTVVYKLTQPITYQIDPVQIATFLGTNNFWSNGNGVVDLEYRADTKLYIEQLTKPSEDDMTANQNITSGGFFMVNNRLFLASVAIAQGSTIIPGTNCTEISLADALNSLNS